MKKITTIWLSVLLALSAGAPSLHAQADDALPALVELLGQTDDTQFQLDLLKGMSEGLKGRRNVKMPEGWETLAAQLARSENAQVRELVQSLSLTFGSASALTELRRQLTDTKADPDSRRQALAALLAAKDPKLVDALLTLLTDSAMRDAALRGLAAYDDARIPVAILKAYPSLNAGEKSDALNTLVARAAFARALLVGVAEGNVPPKELTADIVRQLRQFKDPQINQAVERLWGVARETEKDKLEEMARIKAMIAKGPVGAASRGREVFGRTCQQCHTLFDVGGKVGPDITGSNRGDLDYILHNILDPNAEIPNDYLPTIVETKDERIITGIVTRKDDNAVTLTTANDVVVVPRSEIESMQQSQLSMMPEGLIAALSETEVRDLIAYLKSPAQVPLPTQARQ